MRQQQTRGALLERHRASMPGASKSRYIRTMASSIRTQQETTTSLDGASVLSAATDYFATRNGIYSAFVEKAGPTYVAMRGQGGEDVVFGVADIPGGTRVTGSSYLFDQQIARFLSTLPFHVAPPPAPVLPPLADAAAADATPSAPAA